MLRILATAFLSAAVLLGAIGTLVADADGEPSIPLILAPLAIGAVVAVAMPLARNALLQPLPADASAPERVGIQRFHNAFFMSVGFSNVPAILSVVIASGFDCTPYVTIVGGLVSAAIIALLAWPTRDRVRAAEHRLDRAGARSRLAATYGL